MKAKEISIIPSDPNQEVSTVLAEVPYVLNLNWNSRESKWYLSVRDDEGDPIRLGIPVVLGVLLGRRCADPRFPAGFLFISDTTNQGAEPTLDTLGAQVRMYFCTFAEWREAVAE